MINGLGNYRVSVSTLGNASSSTSTSCANARASADASMLGAAVTCTAAGETLLGLLGCFATVNSAVTALENENRACQTTGPTGGAAPAPASAAGAPSLCADSGTGAIDDLVYSRDLM